MKIRLSVYRSSNEHSTLYPGRKSSPDGRGLISYFSQAREDSVPALAARVGKGMKMDAPAFVPLATPIDIGYAMGDETPFQLIGYLTDDAAALTAALAEPGAAAKRPRS